MYDLEVQAYCLYPKIYNYNYRCVSCTAVATGHGASKTTVLY